MRKYLPPLLIICLCTAGCAAIPPLLSPSASGLQQQQQMQTATMVRLAGNNYRILKANVEGSSRGFALLGLFTFVSPDYVEAVNELYKKAGMTVGTSQAVANIAQQDTSPFFILFSLPKITVRGDLVEFVGPEGQGTPPPAALPAATPPPTTALPPPTPPTFP